MSQKNNFNQDVNEKFDRVKNEHDKYVYTFHHKKLNCISIVYANNEMEAKIKYGKHNNIEDWYISEVRTIEKFENDERKHDLCCNLDNFFSNLRICDLDLITLEKLNEILIGDVDISKLHNINYNMYEIESNYEYEIEHGKMFFDNSLITIKKYENIVKFLCEILNINLNEFVFVDLKSKNDECILNGIKEVEKEYKDKKFISDYPVNLIFKKHYDLKCKYEKTFIGNYDYTTFVIEYAKKLERIILTLIENLDITFKDLDITSLLELEKIKLNNKNNKEDW